MKTQNKLAHDEQGFVLVAALMVMLVLTIIGIAATTNTSIELQIAGNDKVHKKTFYEAEAGAVLGSELLEQSFNCTTGFTNATIAGYINVNELNIANNPSMKSAEIVTKLDDPGDNYDAAYPLKDGVLPNQEVGYLYFGGETNVLPGGALQMAAGYEGKGKAAAQGGVAKVFDIYSQFKGLTNSESIILFGWRHLVGTEGSCNY